MPTAVELERTRRDTLWTAIKATGGPDGVAPSLLRNLNVYSGGRGVYTDAEVTGQVSTTGAVTVSLNVTGKVYPDEVSPDGVVYHYPVTKQPGKDAQEVAATKAAATLQLPVFVITTPTDSTLRDVRLGWIVGWDDESKLFMVTLADGPPAGLVPIDAVDESAFRLTSGQSGSHTTVVSRPGQARFKFEVFRRYGAVCAVCDLAIDGLLDAAHIRDKRYRGSDDPRNGLVLCTLHHRAFDRGMFGIQVGDLGLHPLPQGPLLEDLGITRSDITHLQLRPHTKALEWRWAQWTKLAKEEDPNASQA